MRWRRGWRGKDQPEGMEQQRSIAVLSEVDAVGQGGVQINQPGTARSLKTLPGSGSDLWPWPA
jgi:hypothetical protein